MNMVSNVLHLSRPQKAKTKYMVRKIAIHYLDILRVASLTTDSINLLLFGKVILRKHTHVNMYDHTYTHSVYT